MTKSNLLVMAGVSLALAACNNPDPNRTTSVPAGVKNPTAVVAPITTPSAPPAAALRTPVAPNANTMAPGTNATVAFANPNEQAGAAERQTTAANAQDAAAKAPDTAGADKAKKDVMSGSSGERMSGTAQDTDANSPRHGTLTPKEESTQMPKAGQVNNYSDTALEKDSGRPSDATTDGKSPPSK